MSEEEKNAIKILEDDAYNHTCITKKYCKINEVDGMTCAKCIQQSYDIVEKLIYKQEKVIDLMAEDIYDNDNFWKIKCRVERIEKGKEKDYIKERFFKKVEEEND